MKQNILSLFLIAALINTSCEKYFEKKSDASLIVPTTLEDLQALLDDGNVMNQHTPAILEVPADDMFLTESIFNSLPNQQLAYTWGEYKYRYENDWSLAYSVIYNANLCLERIDKVEKTKQNEILWNNIKGAALFFRAYNMLNLSWAFSKAYDEKSSKNDKGIVLRLSTDFNQPSQRASVQQSYMQILSDLKEAGHFISINTPVTPYRPSRPALYALTARTYLSMRQYDSAFRYADLALQIKDDILDYNDGAVRDGNVPFQNYPYNKEVIFYTKMSNSLSFKAPARASIDTLLFDSYDPDDKRKTVFFLTNRGYPSFKGSYSGSSSDLFTGLATDEVLLIRAECNARLNNLQEAVDDLNTLLKNRWLKGTYTPAVITNQTDLLTTILSERRKELVMRGLRWMDLKRLNAEGANITLIRVVGEQVFSLPPNDARWALPLPDDVIQLTGMQQN